MAVLCPPRPTVDEWTHQVAGRRPVSVSHREYEALKARFQLLFPTASPAEYESAMRAIARATGI